MLIQYFTELKIIDVMYLDILVNLNVFNYRCVTF